MSQSENFEQVRNICKKYLYDADLCELKFREADEIYLGFVIGGDDKITHWLDVCCRGIHVFNVAKDPDEPFTEGFFVGGGRVTKFEGETAVRKTLESSGWKFHDVLPKQAYQFEVEGAIEIKIICTEFFVSERHER
jgi:hypothetical protein